MVHSDSDLILHNSSVLIDKEPENVGIGFLAEIAVHPEDHLVCLPLSDEVQPRFLISLAKRTQQIVTPLQEQVVQVIHEFVTAQKNSSS